MFISIPEHPRYEINSSGVIRDAKSKKIKSQYIGSTGYYMVSFSYNNKSKPQRVHRLLANTFIPNPQNLPEVNHVDGDKLNNELSNLEWVTHRENMSHAFRIGLANNSGTKNGMSKLSESDIPGIRKLILDGVSQYKIAKLYNVSRSAILNIKVRGSWSHVK